MIEDLQLAFSQCRAAPIANLITSLVPVPFGSSLLPMTVNHENVPKNCYICDPTTAYIDYALEELRHFGASPITKFTLALLINLAGCLVRGTGLGVQVQPNNWLFATNIVPKSDDKALSDFTQRLARSYPECAIVWRSLNSYADGETIDLFRRCGYLLMPARQIYLFDCRKVQTSARRDERRDYRLLNAADYTLVSKNEFSQSDFTRIAELYARLYLEKYTILNPQYSAEFLSQLHASGIVDFVGLRGADDQLSGVIGFFSCGDVITAPIVGYDTAVPQDLGLYRRLISIGQQRARDQRLLFNMSAGAPGFKRNRGAVPAIEYTAVYNRHLGMCRQVTTAGMRILLDRIGVPLMKRFGL